MDEQTEALPGEIDTTTEGEKRSESLRRVAADVYTFVRGTEYNRAIASFTLDHYIDEAKRHIKGQRTVQAASRPGEGIGVRLAQLDALTKLEQDFNASYEDLKMVAEKTDSEQKKQEEEA